MGKHLQISKIIGKMCYFYWTF